MSHWKTKAHNLITAQAQLIAQLARETDTTTITRPARGATPAGDEHRLRGIPMQARGVSGTMRGTQPHSALR